ncbi:MAG TPA: PTS sugar transporter subunit IIB [Longimicrobiales bacterium]|nr:PTS sugar transporter subunit IIB [Longimicrobiales bacterium]
MPIVLHRIDERLIHGQVVLGWGGELEPDRYVVVDDDVARAPWEQELYAVGLSGGAGAEFHTVSEARSLYDRWAADDARTILLTRLPEAMRRLGEDGALRGVEINLGGLHHDAGRDMVLPYVFLGQGERDDLRALARAGAVVTAQDVPAASPIALERLLDG